MKGLKKREKNSKKKTDTNFNCSVYIKLKE